MSSQTIHHGVDRNLKSITVITCVGASREHAMPYIIISQKSDDLLEALGKKAIEFGWHLILEKNQKPYPNSKSFAECIKSTFIPHITRIDAARGIEQEDFVLLMENCPSYLTSDAGDLLNTVRVKVVSFAPHTMYIFQLLDLTLFGMFEQRESTIYLSANSEQGPISCTTYI
jgi:hypothetical protein